MQTEDTTLVVVIANLILQPLLQYLLHSRCSRIKCCGIECDRQILNDKQLNDKQLNIDNEENL